MIYTLFFVMSLLGHGQLAFADGIHHVGRGALGQVFLLHEVHVWGHVAEEFPVAGAEVVEARLSVGRAGEAVLGTVAVAGEEPFTLLALAGQGVVFGLAETLLAFAVHHLHQCLLVDVAQFVFGEDKVVARIDVAVELHHTGMAARTRHGADAGSRISGCSTCPHLP